MLSASVFLLVVISVGLDFVGNVDALGNVYGEVTCGTRCGGSFELHRQTAARIVTVPVRQLEGVPKIG